MNDLYIMHYGVGHDKGGHSGRYPWGSGNNKIAKTAKAIKERGVNDVVAGAIVKHKHKKNPYADAGQMVADKERIKAILKNAEAYTVGTLASMALGVAGTLAVRGYYTYKDLKKADQFVDNYKDIKVNEIQVEDIQVENIQTENIQYEKIR